MIPKEQWYWSGYAGHYIGAESCTFALCTRVGAYRVSTVGDKRNERGRHEEVGAGRLFETMVFPLTDDGTPEGDVIDWTGVEMDAYNESREAEKGHYAMCEKWAKAQE